MIKRGKNKLFVTLFKKIYLSIKKRCMYIDNK